MQFTYSLGFYQPYGATRYPEGFNFALFSSHATSVTLCFFEKGTQCTGEITLDPKQNKTGDIWHIFIEKLPDSLFYAYRIDGPHKEGSGEIYQPDNPLLDPYAKALSTTNVWGGNSKFSKDGNQYYTPLAALKAAEPFDWQGVGFPAIPVKDLIIYEMHVRAFTQDSSSKVQSPGTFKGLIEKIPHLVELGINAVELMPIHEFDENETKRFPNPAAHELYNFWGYSTVNFFSPMNRYASDASSSVTEFKTMVRELHRNGIEVILDVVFNHTSEGNEEGPMMSYKGIDTSVYYIEGADKKFSNYTGTGNTFNCNHPVVWQLILDSLRYWHQEMHVDGFRFDLASILLRSPTGEPLGYAPCVEAITHDPMLKDAKLIAEPWDAVGLYNVGSFMPNVLRWGEWNGKYRDAVRRFIKGTPQDGLKGEFITRVCGSQDLYNSRWPLSSINFIIAHDGFTLRDLVSYNEKHNEANAEDNRDGNPQNDSWNCGVEGPTKDKKILALRERQMRNFHMALMVSFGTPMMLMGDEYGHTKNGNNNTWCQDNKLNWFLWDEMQKNSDFFRFYKKMIQFRKNHPQVRREKFLTDKDVQWHGLQPLQPEWDCNHRLVAYTLLDKEKREDLYIAFNTEINDYKLKLPAPPSGKKWHWIVNTANKAPNDFYENPPLVRGATIPIISFSALILKAF